MNTEQAGKPATHERSKSRQLNQRLVALLGEQLDLAAFALHHEPAGAMLHRAGEPLLRLPLIVAGALDAVVHLSEHGNRIVPIGFEAGELGLLSALFAEEPIHVDLIARQPLALRWIPLASVEACLIASQPLLVLVVRFLAQRLREVQARERGWMERGAQERVGALLARSVAELKPEGADSHLWLRATHEELAERCGVSRPKLSHEFKRLERAGKLRLHRGAIEIVDRGAFALPV